MISGILAGGIPGFRIGALLLPAPSEVAHCVFVVGLVVFCFMGLRQHGTQAVICMRRVDTSLSPLASIDLFYPLTGYCHVTAWCLVFVCFCVCCFLFCFWCCCCFCFFVLVFWFVFLMNVTVHWTMYRSSTASAFA